MELFKIVDTDKECKVHRYGPMMFTAITSFLARGSFNLPICQECGKILKQISADRMMLGHERVPLDDIIDRDFDFLRKHSFDEK